MSYVSAEEAIRQLRSDPRNADLVRDTYLDLDVMAAAGRFARSGEWLTVQQLLGGQIRGATVVDLGAGNGMAGRAFIGAGAARVYAVEPDPSCEIGRGAIARVCEGLDVSIVDATGEELPLDSASIDIVFARQVLHHTRNLRKTLCECARVLRSGGVFLACREHVADTPEELARFLAGHAVHRLTGGENAYALTAYRDAIIGAGLKLQRELGPWDSTINLYPAVQSDVEIVGLPARLLAERFGLLGAIAARLPPVAKMAERRLRRPRPGRLHSFLATKP